MNLSPSSIGCGAAELQGLYEFSNYDPAAGDKHPGNIGARKGLYNALRGCSGNVSYAILLFGDGVAHHNGEKFAQFLKDSKLGEVEASKIVVSPMHPEKSHEGYQLWLWYVDRKALLEWYASALKEFEPTPPKKEKPLDFMNAPANAQARPKQLIMQQPDMYGYGARARQ